MATKKFKKYFFLFGEEICRILEEEGVAKAVKAANSGVDFSVYLWDEYSAPTDLLSKADGWNNWMTITESQYEKFLCVSAE